MFADLFFWVYKKYQFMSKVKKFTKKKKKKVILFMSTLSQKEEENSDFSFLQNDAVIDISQISEELESRQKEVDDLFSTLSLLTTEIQEKRAKHKIELSKLKEEIEKTKRNNEENQKNQEERQNEELLEYSKQLEESENFMKSINKKTNEKTELGLKEEIEKMSKTEAQIQQETQFQETIINEDRTRTIPDVVDSEKSSKRIIKNLEFEISSLKGSIEASRKKCQDLLNDLSSSSEIQQISKDEFMKKLKQNYDEREKQQQMHIKMVEGMLENEQEHYKKVDESTKRTLSLMKQKKEKVDKELSSKMNSVMDEIQKASEAVENANKSEEEKNKIISNKIKNDYNITQTLNQLKNREQAMKDEITRLKTINTKAMEYLEYIENQQNKNDSYEEEEDI